jgi:hypothetical protein
MPVPPMGFHPSGPFSIRRASTLSGFLPSCGWLQTLPLLHPHFFCEPRILTHSLHSGFLGSSTFHLLPHCRALLPADVRFPMPAVTPNIGSATLLGFALLRVFSLHRQASSGANPLLGFLCRPSCDPTVCPQESFRWKDRPNSLDLGHPSRGFSPYRPSQIFTPPLLLGYPSGLPWVLPPSFSLLRSFGFAA